MNRLQAATVEANQTTRPKPNLIIQGARRGREEREAFTSRTWNRRRERALTMACRSSTWALKRAKK
tara:strand:+ start:349 stop:546 length:198 start_codon:yes stop_codon:yes gene_type:complete